MIIIIIIIVQDYELWWINSCTRVITSKCKRNQFRWQNLLRTSILCTYIMLYVITFIKNVRGYGYNINIIHLFSIIAINRVVNNYSFGRNRNIVYTRVSYCSSVSNVNRRRCRRLRNKDVRGSDGSVKKQ